MPAKFQDQLDDTLLDAEQNDFRGGANEFSVPTKLGEATSGRLLNVLVEDNGTVRVRPGADALGGSALTAARIDRLVYFDTPSLEYVFAAIASSLRRWNGAAWTTIAAYPFAQTIAEMEQGNNVLYCSDATGQWQSYDGAAWSGALGNTAGDPPVGASIMLWHTTFRMLATGTIGGFYDQIHVSDIGSAGTGDWDSTNWAFRVGRGEGQAIRALCNAKGWWVGVGKEASIYMVNADPTAANAAAWQVKHLAGSVGVVGKRAMLSFGDTILVLGRDGVREIIPTAAEETPFELSPPLSEPLQPYIDRINWAAASKSVFHKFRHYAFLAVPLDSATEPDHVLVWNGRIRAWIGVWTGWTPTAMATSRFADVQRFLIGDSAGKVNQWKDYASTSLDSTYLDNSVGVSYAARSRSFNFGSQRNWKDGESLELEFVDSTAPVTILAVMDGVERKRWTENLLLDSLTLPFTLPATLPDARPATVTKDLDGLPEFKEVYVEIQSSTARVELKSIAASAYLNSTSNE